MLQFKTSLPVNDSNFEKVLEVRQFFPSQELYDSIVECCQEEFDNFSVSGSETINFFCVMHGECHCYVLVIYPCHLLSENLPIYYFVPGGETEKQTEFYQNVVNNFRHIWEAVVEHSAPCREYLLMGGILYGYVDLKTRKLDLFLEIKNVSNPPDELTADG